MLRTVTVRAGMRASCLLVLVACAPEGLSRRDGAPIELDAADNRADADIASADAATPTDATVLDGSHRPDASAPEPDAGADPEPCISIGTACSTGGASCCGDLSCGTTTLGMVCCGEEGASCATADGSDCCGALLCVAGRCQSAGGPPPDFAAPYSCGERWTYSHHSAEVRLALDFVRSDGGATNGAPTLASAPGVARRRFEAGGAGNYVVIEHGDGWRTYYFHLSSYTVADGAWIDTGEQVGRVGSTGASSGAHLHYEQLRGSAGQTIRVRGTSLAPYPGSYGSEHLVSDNGCGMGGRAFDTWGSGRTVHESATRASRVVTTLGAPTRVHVDCQTRGESVTDEGFTNDWWAHLRDEGGYLSNIYIDDPAARLPGVPDCP